MTLGACGGNGSTVTTTGRTPTVTAGRTASDSSTPTTPGSTPTAAAPTSGRGPAMMGNGLWATGGWPATTPGCAPSTRPRQRAAAFADRLGLRVGEVMQFSRNFYAELQTGDGHPATEVLVDPADGAVQIEYGPAMMWNTDYGMSYGTGSRTRVSAGRAKSIALKWLHARDTAPTPGAPESYPGYYTFRILAERQDHRHVVGQRRHRSGLEPHLARQLHPHQPAVSGGGQLPAGSRISAVVRTSAVGMPNAESISRTLCEPKRFPRDPASVPLYACGFRTGQEKQCLRFTESGGNSLLGGALGCHPRSHSLYPAMLGESRRSAARQKLVIATPATGPQDGSRPGPRGRAVRSAGVVGVPRRSDGLTERRYDEGGQGRRRATGRGACRAGRRVPAMPRKPNITLLNERHHNSRALWPR
ncbi:hypothetical protein ACRAWF_35045 [Streptomyces sp. L7]